jgi:hypothetical protein
MFDYEFSGRTGVERCNVILLALLLWGVSLSVATASADVVVDQPPGQAGGPSSDTDYVTDFGQPFSQLIADNIRLDASESIGQVAWYGFYGGNFDEFPEPAPLSEMFRIRFYEARAGDGLPDDSNILFEEFHANPLRMATGLSVAVGPQPPEYRFEVDLTNPVSLAANRDYWLEIVQFGDADSLFRWESGFGTIPGHAFLNPNIPDWQAASGSFAFELSRVPEPSSGALFLFGAFITLWGRGGRRATRR